MDFTPEEIARQREQEQIDRRVELQSVIAQQQAEIARLRAWLGNIRIVAFTESGGDMTQEQWLKHPLRKIGVMVNEAIGKMADENSDEAVRDE